MRSEYFRSIRLDVLKEAVGEEAFEAILRQYEKHAYPAQFMGDYTIEEIKDYLEVVKGKMTIRQYALKYGYVRPGTHHIASAAAYKGLLGVALYFHRHILELKGEQ